MFISPNLIVKRTKRKGHGVFATAEIEPGTVIGDYLGIVTLSDQGPKHDHGSVYDIWYSDEADICPNPKNEGVHLINASCEPNCAMAAIERHTIIFALRRIFPKEELTYDYFMGEQDFDCDPGSDNCSCGSDFCRGTMYSNPKAYDAWDAYLEKSMGDLPHKPPVPYGKKLPPLDHYPATIKDHPIYPLWGTHVRTPMECTVKDFSSLAAIRKLIRTSGKKLCFRELNFLVEGIAFGEHLIGRHVTK